MDEKEKALWREKIIGLGDFSSRKSYYPELQKKMAELRESEEHLRAILFSITDGVIATDSAMRITGINPVAEQLTGWTREEVLGRPLEEIFRQFEVIGGEAVGNAAMIALREERNVRLETEPFLIPRDGVPLRISERAAPLRDASGAIAGTVLVFNDVTERHEMEERLRHSQKMDAIGQLAGGVAHDFNNMLGGILGAAEILSYKVPEDSPLAQYVRIIRDGAERAADLTGKLLSFSRKARVVTALVDVHEVIRAAMSLMEHSFDRKIRIEANLDAAESTIVGDAAILQNAVLNLAINARDAMPDGGDILISTTVETLDAGYIDSLRTAATPGRFICVAVKDSGCGINPHDLQRIFEPFFTTKTQGKGTGLGLPAVYGAIREHKGLINVSSELGRGSVFRLFLPLAREAQTSCALPERSCVAGGGGRILLVDDEEMILGPVTAILSDAGYDVVACKDGADAIERFRKEPESFVLVILDMVMPNLSGRDVFVALREIAGNVRVLVTSGYDREGYVDELMKMGAAGFIRKPYRSATLTQAVREAIGTT